MGKGVEAGTVVTCLRIHCLGKVRHVPRKPCLKVKMSAILVRSETWQQRCPVWDTGSQTLKMDIKFSFYVQVGRFSGRKVYSRRGKLVARLSFVGSSLCFNDVNSGPTLKN